MWSVICFLNVKNMTPAEIHRQLCDVCGEHAMSSSVVRRWVWLFNVQSGWPSVVNEDLVCAVEGKIREKKRFTITSLSLHFPQISWSLLHKIVSDNLKFQKLCARWVPKMLMEKNRLKWQATMLDFLTQYIEEGGNFLSRVFTGDKTWVSHKAPESKQQSMEWRHTSSPTKTKLKHTTSTRKIMCTMFWHSACGLLASRLCNQCRCLLRHTSKIASRDREWVTCLQSTQVSFVTHFKNCIARSRMSDVACLARVLWWFMTMPAHTLLPQRKISSRHLAGNNSIIPPYSPDLAPSDFLLFLHLKSFLAGWRFHDDNKVKDTVTTCFCITGGIILRWRDTKTGATLWQVPQQWWKLYWKLVYGVYIKWQYTWFVIYSCFFLIAHQNLLSG